MVESDGLGFHGDNPPLSSAAGESTRVVVGEAPKNDDTEPSNPTPGPAGYPMRFVGDTALMLGAGESPSTKVGEATMDSGETAICG